MAVYRLFMSLVFTFLGMSYSYAIHQGAVTAATAGSGVAAIEVSESPFLNPAALGHMRGYFFTSSFAQQNQGEFGSGRDMAFSLTDNLQDTALPTSVAYAQMSRLNEQGDEVLRRNFRLSFGGLVLPQIAFGLGVSHQTDRWQEESYSDTNLILGGLWSPTANVGFGLLMENLLEPSARIPELSRPEQRLVLGTSIHINEVVRIKGDFITHLSEGFGKPILAAGLENYLNRWTIFRLGYQRDSIKEADIYAGGLGFSLPRFGIHYAYQRSPQKETLTRHSIDLAVPIW